jgi:hypothetical protein
VIVVYLSCLVVAISMYCCFTLSYHHPLYLNVVKCPGLWILKNFKQSQTVNYVPLLLLEYFCFLFRFVLMFGKE